MGEGAGKEGVLRSHRDGGRRAFGGGDVTDSDLSYPALLQVLVAGPDGYLWAGHKGGLLERYTAGGCLQWYKVRARWATFAALRPVVLDSVATKLN